MAESAQKKGGKSTWKNNDKGNDGKSSGIKRDGKQWGSIGGAKHLIESIAQIARKNAPFGVDLLFDTFDWWKLSAGERTSFF